MPRRSSLRVVSLLGLVALASCKRPLENHEPTHQRRADRAVVLSGKSAAYVRTEQVTRSNAPRAHRLAARVSYDERQVSRIGAPVPGRVASIGVVTGDEVKQGAVLLTLSAPELASAQAQLSQAKTARSLAERTAARAQMLVREGAGTEAERLSAEAALLQAENEEQRASAVLSAIGGAHGPSGYQLRSPMAGTVVERNVSVGSQVRTDESLPLLTVADLKTVWVVADVYERDLPVVHAGDDVVVTVLAYPDRTFRAKISHVGDVVAQSTRAIQARIELANEGGLLRPGMFANVEVRGQSAGEVWVPSSAVLARRDQFFVFVKGGDGAFGQREVHLGDQRGEHSIVTKGLSEGETVVTEGAILLDAEANESL